jgi:hypothetical protein
MSIVRVVMDERENKIHVIRKKDGERSYKLTDRRISAVITALVEIGDQTPLTNWILAPAAESQRPRILGSSGGFSQAVVIPIHDFAEK